MKLFQFAVASTLMIVFLTMGDTAQAQGADNWTFTTTPANGQISGNAGSTIGWGYTIQNLSSTDWLFVTDVESDTPFQYGTATSDPFDDPILAPGSPPLTVEYDGYSGLVDLTWDTDVPNGFVNSGNFIASASYYDGDPFNGGQYVSDAGVRQTAYQATAINPTPEPSAWATIGIGACAVGLLTACRRCRAAHPA